MLRLPTFAHFEITDLCNLRCTHCFHSGVSNIPKSKDLKDEQTIGLVKKIIENQIYSLTLTGGEPFARPKITLKAAEIAKNNNLHVAINTNLLLITKDILQDLKKLKVDTLLVSCPAGNDEVYHKITRAGKYSTFKKKIAMLVKSDIHFLVNMVVTQLNYHVMEETALEMAKLGVKNFALTPASLNIHYPDYDQLLTKNQIFKLFEILLWCKQSLGLQVDTVEPLPKCFYPSWCFEDNYGFTRRVCVAGRKSISVSNTGEVRPCAHNHQSYGNMIEDPLETIWDRMSQYRANTIPDICIDCPTLSQCNGACRIYSIAKYGVANKPDRLAQGPIPLPSNRKHKITINENSIFHFNGDLRYRPEKMNTYSIVSNRNGSNVMVVNDTMFGFVRWLSKSLPLSLKQIQSKTSKDSKKEAQVDIIKSLIHNKFIYDVNN